MAKTQVAVVQSMQVHDSYHTAAMWQSFDGIVERSGLTRPSAGAALAVLETRGYVERRIQIRGVGPYKTRWIQYRLTEVGMAVNV